MRLKIGKKLRTATLSSKFAGSYKYNRSNFSRAKFMETIVLYIFVCTPFLQKQIYKNIFAQNLRTK